MGKPFIGCLAEGRYSMHVEGNKGSVRPESSLQTKFWRKSCRHFVSVSGNASVRTFKSTAEELPDWWGRYWFNHLTRSHGLSFLRFSPAPVTQGGASQVTRQKSKKIKWCAQGNVVPTRPLLTSHFLQPFIIGNGFFFKHNPRHPYSITFIIVVKWKKNTVTVDIRISLKKYPAFLKKNTFNYTQKTGHTHTLTALH